MEKFKLFLHQKKIPFKESIKNTIKIKDIDKGNLSITRYDIIKNKNKMKHKELNQNSNKFSDLSNKLFLKSFNKENALEEFIKNNNTKKSYSIKLKQNNTNKIGNKNNSLNFNIYNFSLKKKHKDKNKNNQTIEVNTISDMRDVHYKKNNLFVTFNNQNNINKTNEQTKYFRTLENISKETINSEHNNNYINNIINININFDKKRKKYRNFLSTSLKDTINYFTDNLFHNGFSTKDKNIKFNFKLNEKNLNMVSSSMKSIKTNSKKNFENLYNHTISNEMKNNNKVRSKNTFLKLLLKNKNKTSNNYITFGKLISKVTKNENKRLHNFDENNLKIVKNNILLKVKNNYINPKNPKFLLLKNNPIIDFNKTKSKKSKKKNYFIQKKKSDEIHGIKYFNHSNKFLNLIHSPKESGIKLFLYNSEKKENLTINNKPEIVKEYNHEILLNLLIDEYIYHKNNNLTLNSEVLQNYGLNPILRSYFIDSLIGLQSTFLFHNKTLFITLQIFDSYISKLITNKIIIKESNIDLIFTACFLIASKSEESFIYHIKDYLSIISDNYKVKDLMSMEYTILKLFDFTAFVPNVLDFFEFFSVLFNLDENRNKKGILILLIIISDLHLSQLSSSFLALSVICLLFGYNLNYNEIFHKLDCIFDNVDKNNENFSINKNDVYNKFLMLLKPLKNIEEIKKTGEKINDYIKYFNGDEFKNVEKKLNELHNLK